MHTKHCTKCQTDKPVTDFRWRNKAKGYRAQWCRSCFSTYEKQHWKQHPTRAKDSVRAADNRRKANLEWVCNYLLEHPCSECSEDDILVLDFDHLDPTEKEFTIGNVARDGMSLERVQQEIAKCRVLCANCHRRHTAQQQNSFRFRFVEEKKWLGVSDSNR